MPATAVENNGIVSRLMPRTHAHRCTHLRARVMQPQPIQGKAYPIQRMALMCRSCMQSQLHNMSNARPSTGFYHGASVPGPCLSYNPPIPGKPLGYQQGMPPLQMQPFHWRNTLHLLAQVPHTGTMSLLSYHGLRIKISETDTVDSETDSVEETRTSHKRQFKLSESTDDLP